MDNSSRRNSSGGARARVQEKFGFRRENENEIYDVIVHTLHVAAAIS